MLLLKLSTLLAAIAVTSCSGITEGDRLALDQTVRAGSFIRENSGEAPIARAGADVEANATVVQATIGKPDREVPYSPEASEAAREQSAKEHAESSGFWGGILKFVGGLFGPWGAVLAGAVGTITGFWKKFQWKKRTTVIADAVEHGIQALKEKEWAEVFKNAMKVYHEGKGTHVEIKHLIATLKAKKKISDSNSAS